MPERTLGIFAKAPVAGRVKTRLAAEIGSQAAAALYRRVGREVVAASVGRDHRTIVWFSPPAAGAAVHAWLDGLGVWSFRAQPPGALGTRLAHAFARSFAEGDGAVVIVGTDCPGLGRRAVAQAFAALRTHDLVLGPARDGGYYLIGLRALEPALFRGIPWSTGDVTRATRARARALGLTCRLLAPLRDVDTARDARVLGLLRRSRRPPSPHRGEGARG